MKKIKYFIIPIILTFLAYHISINFIFNIPLPGNKGYAGITYLVAIILAIFTLGVSSIISAILYVGHKKSSNKNDITEENKNEYL